MINKLECNEFFFKLQKIRFHYRRISRCKSDKGKKNDDADTCLHAHIGSPIVFNIFSHFEHNRSSINSWIGCVFENTSNHGANPPENIIISFTISPSR